MGRTRRESGPKNRAGQWYCPQDTGWLNRVPGSHVEGALPVINLLQKSLDRRRIVKGGVAAGAAMAFNPFSGLVSAQEAEDFPTDASAMDALVPGAQKENKI